MKKKVIAAALILILAAVNIPSINAFTITDGKSGKVVLAGRISDFKSFYISFRHSFNRTPVNEFYKIDNGEFIAYMTTFYSYGAGMPELVPGGKEKISFENGLVKIENIDRRMERFTVRVGTYADHTLICGSRSVKLSEYVKPQSPAVFDIKRVSPVTFLRYGGNYRKE